MGIGRHEPLLPLKRAFTYVRVNKGGNGMRKISRRALMLFAGTLVLVAPACASQAPMSDQNGSSNGSSSSGHSNGGGSGGTGTNASAWAGSSKLAAQEATDAFFASLPKGDDARAVLCNPPLGRDDVVGHLCVPTPPVLHNLKDLQKVLGFDFQNPNAGASNGGSDGNPAYAITGHSSSLVVDEVSSINPRVVMCRDFGPIANSNNLPNPRFFSCMGFARGENIVEVATTDAGTGILNFYIIRFDTPCSVAGTCTPAEALSPESEANWVGYNAYEDDPFLKNTILDCRQCHQPDNSVDPILRLQENTAPYSHFFSSKTAGGKALLADFHAAHGTNEDYGPIPAALIDGSDAAVIAKFLSDEHFATQPNPYDSNVIEAQVDASSPLQPSNNSVPGSSTAWNQLFTNFTTGKDIPPPFHDIKVTDPNKLATMTQAYQAYMNGSAKTMPDIRDVFSSDQNILAQMGLAVVPGQDANGLFVNACMQCHNSTLDQNLTRARFNVTTLLQGQMTAAEKQLAVTRLQKDANSVQLMPPVRFRQLQPSEIQTMVQFLERP